ncbi:MAG: DUF2029 domain-containing protein [SAR324 cluster bacterium]|uniref:DUF2029 domain-containing protein n=1 Tax=SAR324 cluster bacterium TaxID=2024889 RepID=A0A7X9FRP3_9DELT|nr:DUF2029 domain-containing protein [SAR324 cluster bacterium]
MASLAFYDGRPERYKDIGTWDFVQYWSAYRATSEGLNPYDPENLLPFQRSVGVEASKVIMMWNPPWVLVLLSPVLRLEFFSAASLWLIISFFCLAASTQVAINAMTSKSSIYERCLAIALLIFFSPAQQGLKYGQLEGLLTLGIALLFLGFKRKSFVAAGFGLALMSIKPHLFYLLAILIPLFPRPNVQSLSRLLLPTVVLILLSEFLFRGSVSMWLQAMLSYTPSVPNPINWRSSSFGDFLRGIWEYYYGFLPQWPRIFVPMLFFGVSGLYIFRSGGKQLSREKLFLFLLPLSIFSAPYSWPFDQSVILVAHVSIVIMVLRSLCSPWLKLSLIASVFCLNLLTLIISELFFTYQHHLFWYPLACFALFSIVLLQLKEPLN